MGTGESGLFSEVAIVEGFKQESMYGVSAQKVAVVERWPLVDVRLYFFNIFLYNYVVVAHIRLRCQELMIKS